ncbi:MAG: PhoH family protein [Alphaproteobacteria bacterium]|nr:PhoH family protein [Alphaproteobacteria bacterium]
MSRKAKRLQRQAAREQQFQQEKWQKEQVQLEPIAPRGEAQKAYFNALLRAEMTIAVGPAGSGKTYLPTALAVNMLLAGDIDKIVLCRPAVEAGGEKHGFMPGGLFEKVQNWMLPFLDVIEERVGRQMMGTWIRDGKIEFMPFSFMRGRSLKNVFIILDEAQNTTVPQMKLFLTRIGEGTRVVINGDVTQRDIREPDGLSRAIEMVDKFDMPVEIVHFTSADIVRSGRCQAWVEAFENYPT